MLTSTDLALWRAETEREMCDTCTIQRGTESTNSYGDVTYGSFVDHLTGQVCRWWEVQSTGEQPGTPRTIITAESYLSLPVGTDVTENDQVTLVTDASGTDVVSTTRNITSIRQTWTEMILTLEEVR